MKVAEVLRLKGAEVLTVRASETVGVFAHRLRMARVGAMVVSRDGQGVDGMVSERDVTWAIAGHGAKAVGLSVADIMSTRVVTCTPDDTIATVARRMTEHRMRHLPVVEDGRLVGLVSIGDVVRHRLEEMELEASVLRDMAALAT